MTTNLTDEERVTVAAWSRECGPDFDAVKAIISRLSTALGNESGLRKELGELVERWRSKAIEQNGFMLEAIGRKDESATRNACVALALGTCSSELEALLAKGGGK